MVELKNKINKDVLSKRVNRSLRFCLTALLELPVVINPEYRATLLLSQLSGKERQKYALRSLERTLEFIDKVSFEEMIEPNLLYRSIQTLFSFNPKAELFRDLTEKNKNGL